MRPLHVIVREWVGVRVGVVRMGHSVVREGGRGGGGVVVLGGVTIEVEVPLGRMKLYQILREEMEMEMEFWVLE